MWKSWYRTKSIKINIRKKISWKRCEKSWYRTKSIKINIRKKISRKRCEKSCRKAVNKLNWKYYKSSSSEKTLRLKRLLLSKRKYETNMSSL